MTHLVWPSKDRTRGKSRVQDKSELTNNGYIGRDLAKLDQIDVLSAMHSGSRLLKLCSRRLKSHWRMFQLDASNISMKWVSDKKDVNDTTILIQNILEIVCYNKTVVDKFKDTLPDDLHHSHDVELQQQQFTIRYMESNKNLTHYIPQLSPHHSLTAYHGNNNSMNIINGLSLTHKQSNSFIQSLKTNSNPNKNTFIRKQPDYADESVTDSSSGHKHRRSKSGSFWKKILKTTSDNNHNHKDSAKEPTPDTTHIHHPHNMDNTDNKHERNYTDSMKLAQGYHVQELHLMAENTKMASIWIYGLENLIEAQKNGIDLMSISAANYPLFLISTRQLLTYVHDKYRNMNNSSHPQADESIISPFEQRVDSVNTALYNVIALLTENQQSILEDNKMRNFSTEPSKIAYIMKKIRRDQNDLDNILRQLRKRRLDRTILNEWSYTLTRIEINIGGYKIGIHENGKHSKKQISNEFDPQSGILSGHQMRRHQRERSKSSSVYSTNYSNHFQSPLGIANVAQYSNGSKLHKVRRQSRDNSKSNKGNILKDRSPRSPFSDHKADDEKILSAPHEMEKYDSI